MPGAYRIYTPVSRGWEFWMSSPEGGEGEADLLALISYILFLRLARFTVISRKIFFCFQFLLFFTSLTAQDIYSADPLVIAKGKVLFEEYCSSCHNFTAKSIGPALQKATHEAPKGWLKEFIRNAPEVVNSGDKRATGLVQEYQQVMPPFSFLEEGQVDAILAYIHQNMSLQPVETDSGSIANPVPKPIPSAGGVIRLTHHSTAPPTGSQAPLARINKMAVLKGKKERMFIVDLEGILYEIIGTTWQVALDMRVQSPQLMTRPGLGTGFGSFAFHPDFEKNHLLYTTHAEHVTGIPADFPMPEPIKASLQWVLTEWEIENPEKLPFTFTKRREILRFDLLLNSHGVQEIAFNPKARNGDKDYGLLYLCIGDGGAIEKKGMHFLCSNNTMVYGSVLRIDPQGKNSRNGKYGIPDVNPYAQATDPAVVKEIYCRGFRNPNRISWKSDGQMLIHDIGQTNIEEINIGLPGADYGWPEREGTFVFNPRGNVHLVYPLDAQEVPGRYTYPVLQYDHDEGKAISGGFEYRGKAAPRLKGKFLFSDIANGRIFMTDGKALKPGRMAEPVEVDVEIDGERVSFQKFLSPAKPDVRLGVGLDNELYFFSKANGRLYKVSGFTYSR